MKKNVFTLAASIFSLLLLSCASNKAENDSAMYSMVYDYDNNEVPGACFYIDKKLIGESDVHGRFMLALKEKKEYTVEIVKSGYKTEKVTFYYEPNYVLYIKMGNAQQFTTLSEKALDLKKYADALRYADYALTLDETKTDTLYLKAIILNMTGRFTESNEVLAKIKKRSINKKFIEELENKNNLRKTV